MGEGWIYYAFTNPATGLDEPKASYVKSIDWDGIPAAIGSGIYRRDLPGTCRREEVNAAVLGMESVQRKAAGIRPLRRHGNGIDGVLRFHQPLL